MFELPKNVIEAKNVDPKSVFIFSQPKVGKTSLTESLPNHLLIDVEGGSSYVNAVKINIPELAAEMYPEENRHNKLAAQLTTYKMVVDKLREEIFKGKNVSPYDFLVVDTTTKLEELATELAAQMYRNTPMGKAWKGSDITNLPNGAGYGWQREAFSMMYTPLLTLCNKAVILLGHTKKSSITKEGKELSAQDINLTGKLKIIVAADVDAVGFIYRDRSGSKNIISFKNHEQDLATGARPAHLANQEFVISEKVDGKIITHWDLIFPSLKKN